MLEFLALTKYNNIKDWLNNYNDYGAIGVNWRLFGDNGLEKVVDNNYSVIERFTKADKNQFHLIKTIINFNKPNPGACFKGDPHHINISLSSNYTINTKKTGYIKGPRNYNYNDPLHGFDNADGVSFFGSAGSFTSSETITFTLTNGTKTYTRSFTGKTLKNGDAIIMDGPDSGKWTDITE